MNFLLKLIAVVVIMFVGAAYIANHQSKETVGEVTLDDLGKTASDGANKIRHYLVNNAKKDSQEILNKTTKTVKEITE
jgi:type III secretory pathway component EscR